MPGKSRQGRLRFALPAVIAFMIAANPAAGAVTRYAVDLNGLQATPCNSSLATGTAGVLIDGTAHTMRLVISPSRASRARPRPHGLRSVPGITAVGSRGGRLTRSLE